MRFARPQSGFNVSLTATVAAMIAAEIQREPIFERHWGDVIERLKFTAHRDGVEEPRLGKGYRLTTFLGIQSEARPKIIVGYLVLGDTVRITLLSISR